MTETTQIFVEPDLLPQVLRELFEYTANPDDVVVTDGDNGRVVIVPLGLAERWFASRPQYDTVFADEDEPVRRKRGRPRKVTSAPPEVRS